MSVIIGLNTAVAAAAAPTQLRDEAKAFTVIIDAARNGGVRWETTGFEFSVAFASLGGGSGAMNAALCDQASRMMARAPLASAAYGDLGLALTAAQAAPLAAAAAPPAAAGRPAPAVVPLTETDIPVAQVAIAFPNRFGLADLSGAAIATRQSLLIQAAFARMRRADLSENVEGLFASAGARPYNTRHFLALVELLIVTIAGITPAQWNTLPKWVQYRITVSSSAGLCNRALAAVNGNLQGLFGPLSRTAIGNAAAAPWDSALDARIPETAKATAYVVLKANGILPSSWYQGIKAVAASPVLALRSIENLVEAEIAAGGLTQAAAGAMTAANRNTAAGNIAIAL